MARAASTFDLQSIGGVVHFRISSGIHDGHDYQDGGQRETSGYHHDAIPCYPRTVVDAFAVRDIEAGMLDAD